MFIRIQQRFFYFFNLEKIIFLSSPLSYWPGHQRAGEGSVTRFIYLHQKQQSFRKDREKIFFYQGSGGLNLTFPLSQWSEHFTLSINPIGILWFQLQLSKNTIVCYWKSVFRSVAPLITVSLVCLLLTLQIFLHIWLFIDFSS